jgi:hypothetical protein
MGAARLQNRMGMALPSSLDTRAPRCLHVVLSCFFRKRADLVHRKACHLWLFPSLFLLENKKQKRDYHALY